MWLAEFSGCTASSCPAHRETSHSSNRARPTTGEEGGKRGARTYSRGGCARRCCPSGQRRCAGSACGGGGRTGSVSVCLSGLAPHARALDSRQHTCLQYCEAYSPSDRCRRATRRSRASAHIPAHPMRQTSPHSLAAAPHALVAMHAPTTVQDHFVRQASLLLTLRLRSAPNCP
jgi:hypothetical protein